MGWDALSNNTTTIACPENWKYRSDEGLGSHRSQGVHALYGGGGYVVNLGYEAKTARWILNDITKKGWIDRQTRVVMVELSTFNVATKLLTVTTLYFEMLPSGYLGTSTRTQVMPLFKTDSTLTEVYLVTFLIFAFALGYYLVSECIRISQLKCSYFLSIWNWLEMLQIISAILVMAFSIQREVETSSVLQQLKRNPFVSVSFHETLFWFQTENSMICIAVTVVVLRLLRLLKFNKNVIVLFLAMRKSLRPVMSFTVVLALVFVAYGHAGCLLFGKNVYMFSSFKRVIVSQFLMSLGSPAPHSELQQVDRVLAKLYSQSFLFVTMIILMNMFVAILNEAHTESNISAKENDDMEVANLLLSNILNFLSVNRAHSSTASHERESLKERPETGEISSTTDTQEGSKLEVSDDTEVSSKCMAKKPSQTNDSHGCLEPLVSAPCRDRYAMPSTPRNSFNGQSEPIGLCCSVLPDGYAIPSIQTNTIVGQSDPSQFCGSLLFPERCEMSSASQYSSYEDMKTSTILNSSMLVGEQNDPTDILRYWLSPASSTLSLDSLTSLSEQRQPSALPLNSPSPDKHAKSSISRNSFDAQLGPTNLFSSSFSPDSYAMPSTRNSFDVKSEEELFCFSVTPGSYYGQIQPLPLPERSTFSHRSATSSTAHNSFNSESSLKGFSPIVDVDNKNNLESDTTRTVHFASDVKIKHFRVRSWDSSNDSVDHSYLSAKQGKERGSGTKTTNNNASVGKRSEGITATSQTNEWSRPVSDEPRANIIDFDEVSKWMKKARYSRNTSQHTATSIVSQNSRRIVVDFDAVSKMIKKTRQGRKGGVTKNTAQLENRAKRLHELLQALDLFE